MGRKTHEQFLDEVHGLVGNEYTVLSNYQGATKKIKFKHNVCGREYEINARGFLLGSRCKNCARRKTHSQFLKEVHEKVGSEYKIVGKYENAYTKIKIKHEECGNEFEMRPSHFLKGSRCPRCQRPNYNRNTEQFKKEVKDTLGNDYIVLGEYEGYKKKVLMKHISCGMKYHKTPAQTLNGVGCPFCNLSGVKTQEIFDYQVKKQVGNEYTFLSPYRKNQIKMKVRHNICGYEYEVTPNGFLQGSRCPDCYEKNRGETQRHTHEQFVTRIFGIVGDEYTVLTTYTKATDKIRMKHNKCGQEWEVTADSFIRGTRCPECATKQRGLSRRTTKEEFLQRLAELEGNRYSLIGDYEKLGKKVVMKHNECGYIYQVVPQYFLSGNRCPKCADESRRRKRTRTIGEYKRMIRRLVGDEYDVIEEKYKTSKEKIQMRHNICGHVYKVAPEKFIYGRRCPNCHSSNGEQRINTFLTKIELNFKRQHTFDDCVYETKLRFDFAIFDKGEVVALIEYDGRQHYEPIDYFGGFGSFEKTKIRDEIKDKYCKQKNLPLIRIPYHENDIEEFLSKKLNYILNTC